MGRFAPSPTGMLHLGTARTALCAWARARAVGGRFVLRVEDLDPPRVVPGSEAAILEDLRWLGIDWDEGPDVGGPASPYRQSERTERYREALARLELAGLVYPCWCSRKALRAIASAPHGASDEGPRYPGTCATLDEAARRTRAATRGRTPAMRFRVPPGDVAIDDAVAGELVQNVAAEVGDFVVRRADGLFAYQLAVVIDDAAMGVTEVVRGDDLLASTPRQVLLFRALGAPVPAFAHVPLVRGPDGERLAKRHGAESLRELRARGVEAERVVGALAASLGWVPRGERVAACELPARFDWSSVRAATASLELPSSAATERPEG